MPTIFERADAYLAMSNAQLDRAMELCAPDLLLAARLSSVRVEPASATAAQQTK